MDKLPATASKVARAEARAMAAALGTDVVVIYHDPSDTFWLDLPTGEEYLRLTLTRRQIDTLRRALIKAEPKPPRCPHCGGRTHSNGVRDWICTQCLCTTPKAPKPRGGKREGAGRKPANP